MKKIDVRELIAKAALRLSAGFRRGPFLAALAALFFCSALIITGMDSGSVKDIEAGRVADRDIIAGETVSYEDEEATKLRLEARERLVPAVFRFSPQAADEALQNWDGFAAAVRRLLPVSSPANFRLSVESDYPGAFSGGLLDSLYNAADAETVLSGAGAALATLLARGVFAMPLTGLEDRNPDKVELLTFGERGAERLYLDMGSVVTLDSAADALAGIAAAENMPPGLAAMAAGLLAPFVQEDVFYSPEDTAIRVAEARNGTEPVMKVIEKGKKVIRKGFLVTEGDMAELKVLRMSLPGNDPRSIFANLMIMLFIFVFLLFYSGRRTTGRPLSDAEIYLVVIISALYLGGAVFARDIGFGEKGIPVSTVIPTALAIMLPAILISSRLARLLSFVLPVGAFFTGSFDMGACFFALVSGVAASSALEGAQKRMDLVTAGSKIAAVNCVAVIAMLLYQRSQASSYPLALFLAALNGLVSGMMVAGVLPPLEHALNALTPFRLIELSDLNSPVLRRLFSAAPGTYSHSLMVANLAEAACQDIGANALLARVGAYYHDIGKAEQPDYFVENQTAGNRHDGIAPRLSAAVIRSHVKLGVEKARALGLPREVVDIIAEHHGNSVIAWFYDKAMKQEGEVDVEDFSYQGAPPCSKESAVVMLADIVEAAVRTLDKPTAPKLEKFIQRLIDEKVEHGQLALSNLSFRDLSAIRKAFVRVLAGHYHARIEYPKVEIPKREGRKAKT